MASVKPQRGCHNPSPGLLHVVIVEVKDNCANLLQWSASPLQSKSRSIFVSKSDTFTPVEQCWAWEYGVTISKMMKILWETMGKRSLLPSTSIFLRKRSVRSCGGASHADWVDSEKIPELHQTALLSNKNWKFSHVITLYNNMLQYGIITYHNI